MRQWHRIYSSFLDGRSFNRLEWSLLGYSGPTVLLVKTTAQAVLGAFASAPWKNARDFYGNADCFLFELEPKLVVHRPEGSGSNFMYLHSDRDPISVSCHGHAHGLGFGGDLDKPRLFIPETFERCTADFLDKTFHNGELLPSEALERFEIQVLEVWGVGGDEVIAQALRHRSEHRERSDTAVLRARKVLDKSPFVEDLKSGLIINKVYKHQEQARGRHDFRVDDEHGGYKIDH
jgi:TLD